MEEDQKMPVVEDVPISPSSEKEPGSPLSPSATSPAKSLPTYRPGSKGNMTESSTPLGQVNAARRGVVPPPRPIASLGGQSGGLNQDIMARMKAFSLSRQGAPAGLAHTTSTGGIPSSAPGPVPSNGVGSPVHGSPHAVPVGAFAGGLAGRLPPGGRPQAPNWSSAPKLTLDEPPARWTGSQTTQAGVEALRRHRTVADDQNIARSKR